MTIFVGTNFSGGTDSGATWTDTYDGSGNIPSFNAGSIDINATGSYVVSYEYVDVSGNTGSISRTVNVIAVPDVTPPVVTLVGGNVTLEYGSGFSDDGATWTDNIDGSGTIAFATSGSVNTGAL